MPGAGNGPVQTIIDRVREGQANPARWDKKKVSDRGSQAHI